MKNEYTITKRLIRSWEKGWYFNSAVNTVVLILYCSLVAFCLVLPHPFTYLIRHEAVYERFYPVIFAIFHSIALLTAHLTYVIPRTMYSNPGDPNHQNNHYKTCSKNYCAKKWQRVIELTENEIIVDDKYAVLKFEYSTIKRVKEKRNMVIIFLKSGFEIRLYKNAFATGSWEECKKLLSRKSSINIK